ncbi:MAG: glycosyltransferase family 4 protein [Sphingomicrobium sp.]
MPELDLQRTARGSSPQRRLTYVLNHLSSDDSQHYVHIPNLLAELSRLGWHIDLVSERGGRGEKEVLGHRVTYLSTGRQVIRFARLARLLVRMRRQGGRLVFVRISKHAAMVSAILGRLMGWRTLFWLSGTVEDFNRRTRGWKGRLEHLYLWLVFRLVDRLVTGPETMLSYYKSTYGLPAAKVALLYNDVDLSAVAAAAPLADVAPPRVLMVHRLSPVRETARYFPALLAALGELASSHSSVTLDVVGDGPERAELERIAARAADGLHVRFLGAVPNRDLDRFYASATLFVMPSYREGFPRVILEAMARGLPIVATDAGGTRDLVGPLQDRFIIDRDSPEALAAAVASLLAQPALRAALSSENLERVKRFSTPAVAAMYDRTLTEVLKPR